ncbi:hypothetical protein [Hahella sp. HN01]|uniref:hypothetical protein n=1 Tax=Hahella sp. HN01 TaxID=2847262 RepID=UPI001C1E9BAF|nr:hypothetical protein [Hahella sp. HN01]MBU6955535.1 hypothetical protein [Hahella sp. HN01]
MNYKLLTATALLLGTNAALAAGTNTICEFLGSGRVACDTFVSDSGAYLTSQTWRAEYGAIIEDQGVGYMVARCTSSTSDGRYYFMATLSDGGSVTQNGALGCSVGGGTGTPGPGQGCTIWVNDQCHEPQ